MNLDLSKIYYEDGKKFITTRPVFIQTLVLGYFVSMEHITLQENGMLRVDRGFAWDGASGGLDTMGTIRASCAHDALYKLMRYELIPRSEQGNADRTLREVMRRDGAVVSRLWAWFKAVSWFGRRNTDPNNKAEELVAP